MKFALIAFVFLLAVIASPAFVMAQGGIQAGQPSSVRLGMMSGADHQAGIVPSMNLRLHVGPRMISLGTFTYVMGRDETAPTYQLLRTVEK